MKRKLLVISCVAISILGGYYVYSNDKNEKNQLKGVTHNSNSSTISNQITAQQQTIKSPAINKNFQKTRLQQLTFAHAQCQQRSYDFNEYVDEVHIGVNAALEKELKQGKTDRELLAYEAQYQTFYDSYQDLLIEAKINIEKHKYSITQSVSILNEWSGMSVIEGFSADTLNELVSALQPLENENHGFGVNISLAQDINKEDIYALLDNNDNFSTYLESPLAIGSSLILSPSILFILSAENLNIEEYEQAVALRTFTVNDVAIALNNNMETEYLIPLLKQTKSLGDMPILAQERFKRYNNLADIAAANFNVDALEFLNKYGVNPINEPGILTAMDIAILNLPRNDAEYNKLNPDTNKILDTPSYLKAEGYKAHGKIEQLNNLTVTYFKAPKNARTNSHSISNPKFKSLLKSIPLMDNSFNVKQRKADDSVISLAITDSKNKQIALKRKSEQCASVKQQLLAEQSFEGRDKAYDIIDEIKQNPIDVKQRLHQIDPVLVGLWQELEFSYNRAPLESDPSDKFDRLLAEGNAAQAVEYCAQIPLTQTQTDALFHYMLHSNIEFLSAWSVRVSPQMPSNLLSLKGLPVDKWQDLLHQGFDFSIIDLVGNDTYIAAALNSPQAIQFLVENNFKLDTDKYGLDALDTLLELSYENGQLHESLPKLISLYPKFRSSHYARVTRIKKFYPEEYQHLISINKALTPMAGTELNKFRRRYF
ncbi:MULTISPECIES: hypothetical protein [unclassified Shewanella]|uniref:hypothetical protein n=1 Tax=unclassified Shewanella TaxID=196818 RepID=UPI001BC215D3|nr:MULTISPECIES: hypothetical protein [unclassified Shewanella]GIU15668.1 hypothetical protein TUM4444_27250 [Shewanella sp. MBTL60-112-B1]GIU33661.1 hypothetical protein TUM4445_21090 [Shewanella sp. MBTL60-112-B2]